MAKKSLLKRHRYRARRSDKLGGAPLAQPRSDADHRRYLITSESGVKMHPSVRLGARTPELDEHLGDLPDTVLIKVMGGTPPKKITHALQVVQSEFDKHGYTIVAKIKTRASSLLGDMPPWDPYAAGRREIESLTQFGGKPLTREEAKDRLGITRTTIYNRIHGNGLVVFTDEAGRYRFPTWQFGTHGLLPGVAECLRVLDTKDYWAVLRFFLTPSERAGHVLPLQLLREGRIEEAKEIASAAAAHG